MAAREAWHRNDRFPLPALRTSDSRRYRICTGLAPRVAKCCLRTEKIASRDVLTNRRKNSASSSPFIEIHTGCYADAKTDAEQAQELARIAKAATFAASLGLKVNAGHGLTYHNVKAIAAIPEMHELNIGHAIIGRAVMTGLRF